MMPDFAQKDRMTPRERLMGLVAGTSIDRVPFNPFSLGFSARLCGIDRGEFYRNPEKAFAAGLHLMETYPWMAARPAYGWADRGAWEFGGDIIWPDDNRFAAPQSAGPLIRDPAEVDSLPDPDPETAGMNPLVARFNALSRQHGFPASLPGGTPTSLSSAIVGTTDFLKWFIRYPEAAHKLQRKVTDFLLRSADLTLGRYGGENCSVQCSVPVESNQLISAQAFERFAKPYIAEILAHYIAAGVRTIVVHLCGDHTANLPHFVAVRFPPRTVFSVGHEMDLEKTGQGLGKDYILAGNIDTGVLQAGSPEQVFEETRRCLQIGMNHSGGFMLMPACELPPDTPIANVEAVAGALHTYGYY